MTFTCQYCNKNFVKEGTLQVHMCVGKQRAIVKDEQHVRIGFIAYQKFFTFTQPNSNSKTYSEFAKSPYYTAFVKFGSFVNNVKPLYKDRFIDYMVRSGVKLDKWCDEQIYEKYVLELIKSESMETAIERSVATMIEWSEKNKSNWTEYFDQATCHRLVYDIKDGKISPWVILNSAKGKQAIGKLTDDQLKYINNIIDPSFWIVKFKRQPSDVKSIRQIISAGEF